MNTESWLELALELLSTILMFVRELAGNLLTL